MAYGQVNYKDQLGTCSETIASAGCYLTTDADIATWAGHPITPPQLNELYRVNGIYENGCLLPNTALHVAFPDLFDIDAVYTFSGPADLSKLNNDPADIYVIVGIWFPNGLVGKDHPHWAPIYSWGGGVPSKITIVDSYDGQIKPLSHYGDPATIICTIVRVRSKSAAAPVVIVPPPLPVPVPPPIPPPAPSPPFTGDPSALVGKWCWEWNEQGDYAHLKALGFDGVLIRAGNGEGGAADAAFRTAWVARAPLARAAGLKAAAWTYWYGPGDPGYTETDHAAYHLREAQHAADSALDTPAWVVDYESRDAAGLAPALASLRGKTGKAVILAPPGDPAEYGLSWPWAELNAAVDGYAPQLYTGAWKDRPTLEAALAEWGPMSPEPIYPVADEQAPDLASRWVTTIKARGFKGWSYWRSGAGTDATLKAYAETIDVIPPVAPPVVPPTSSDPPPPAPPGGWDVLLEWLRAIFRWFTR